MRARAPGRFSANACPADRENYVEILTALLVGFFMGPLALLLSTEDVQAKRYRIFMAAGIFCNISYGFMQVCNEPAEPTDMASKCYEHASDASRRPH